MKARRVAIEPLYPRGAKAKKRLTGLLTRSEEHTSELQSRLHLVCRLLLEKKKKTKASPINVSPCNYWTKRVGSYHLTMSTVAQIARLRRHGKRRRTHRPALTTASTTVTV